MLKKNMENTEIIIHRIGFFDINRSHMLREMQFSCRTCECYELDFMLTPREIYIDSKKILLEKGDIHFRKPGEIFDSASDDCKCYFVWFDINAPEKEKNILNELPSVIHLSDGSEILNLFEKCFNKRKNNSLVEKLILKSYICKILSIICSEASGITGDDYYPHPHYIRKALQYININTSEFISIERVAEHVCLSTKYFQRVFKKHMGITPKNYIIKMKMEETAELLSKTNLPISVIAQNYSFSTSSHFSETFRKHFGISPTEFRNKH